MKTQRVSEMSEASGRIRRAIRRPAFEGVSLLALALAAGMTMTSPASAQSPTNWTGDVSDDWFEAGNWTGGTPGPFQDTTVNGMARPPVIAGGGQAETGFLVVGESGPGALTIEDGGLSAYHVSIGMDGGDGSVLVTGPNAALTSSTTIALGLTGSGALEIRDGAAVTSLQGVVGADADSFGAVTVDGANWTTTIMSAGMFIGYGGEGHFTVSGAGSVNTDGAYLGYSAGSSGSLTVTGAGSAWLDGGDMYVGGPFGGSGNLTVSDGGFLQVSNSLYVGFGGEGAASVSGADTHVDVWGGLSVGGAVGGALTISDGATVESQWGDIEAAAGSGVVTVTGAGAAWIMPEFGFGLTIGLDGSGALIVTDGARVETGEIFIAARDGADGALTISDGGQVRASVVLISGEAGANGALRLESGGVLETAQIQSYGGDGAVTFDGGVLRMTGNQTQLFQGLATGDVTLAAGGGAIDTNGFNNVHLDIGLVGTGGLTKTGGGTLHMWEPSSYSGATLVEQGTLRARAANVLSAASTHEISAGATLRLDGAGPQTIGGLAGSGSVVLGASTLTVGANDASTSFGGVISGSGSLVKIGAGALTLTGANTWTGQTTVRDGTLTFDGGSVSLAADIFVGLHNGDDGALIITDSGAVSSWSGIVGNADGAIGAVTVTGAGSVWANSAALSVGDAGDGTLIIADGGMVSASAVTLATNAGATGALTIGADSTDPLDAVAAGTLDAATVTFGAGDGVLNFNHTTADYDFGAAISGAGTVNLYAGHTVLSGDSSYTGATTLHGGTLTLGHDNALGASTLTTMGSVVDYADGVNIANSIILDSNSTQFQVLTGSATQSGAISEANGPRPFVKIGDGELVLTGANGWTGAAVIHAGTLAFAGGSANLAEIAVVGDQDGDDGTLAIRNGGQLGSAAGFIGYEEGATGAAVVTGPGSAWASNGGLFVGYAGEGALTVADGGEVTSAAGSIGVNTGSSGAATVTGAGSTWTNGGLMIGDNGSGALTVADGGAVLSGGGLLGYAAVSNGTATVSGAGSAWTSSGDLLIGFNGSGVLTVADGGGVSNGNGFIGVNSGSNGAATVTGAGSNWTNNGLLLVGERGFGTLTVADGAAVSNGGAQIGAYLGSNGAVTVTGAGSTWASGDLLVGIGGEGSLTVADGGAVSSVQAQISGSGGSSGAATVTGAGSTWTNGYLQIGSGGTGSLTIANGGAVSNTGGEVGRSIGSSGVVTVTGAGSTWTSSEDLRIGVRGAGALTVADGGAVSSAGISYIASDAGSTGAATVTGAGSIWTHGGLLIGDNGSGELTVADGGALSGTDALLGYAAGSSGAATVTGTGSAWTNSGNLNIGVSGLGALTIENGATLSSRVGYLGRNIGSNGAAIVTGAGSAWTNSGALLVGEGGAGALTVADGGAASNTLGYIGLSAGSSGAVTVTGTGSAWTGGDDLFIGFQGAGTVTVANGGLAAAPSVILAEHAGATGVLRLEGGAGGGGVLQTRQVRRGGGTSASVVFDGGALRLAANQSNLFAGFVDGEVTIAAGGARIDTQHFNVATAAGLSGSGGLTKLGGGVLILTGASAYTGGTAISAGTLQLGAGGTSGSILGDVANNGVLAINRSDAYSFAGAISGGGAFRQAGGGTTTLTGANTYAGATDVDAGVLRAGAVNAFSAASAHRVAAGATLALAGFGQTVGSLAGGGNVLLGSATLTTGGDGASTTFSGVISGGGALVKTGAGTMTLSGANTHAGATDVRGGRLDVTGSLTSAVTVRAGAALSGSGAVLGDVRVGAGTLAGRSGQTLDIGGSLVLSSGSIVAVSLGAPGSSGLFDVGGDLALDGVLQVTDLGGFGPGVYRLFDYGGSLTDGGLEIGSTPTGFSVADLSVQAAAAGQVNLVSAAGVELRFWDGAGPAGDGVIQGGSGTWSASAANWTSADRTVSGAYGGPSFAVFQGTGGTVTLDGPGLGVTGAQFAVDGYRVQGGSLALTAAETIVRVGDGAAAGAGMTAVIASNLTGAGRLVKTDLGTLILTGANSYAGGTEVRGGTLVGNAASIRGDVRNAATLVFDQATDAVFADTITGDGLTIKRGAGVLNLTGSNAANWLVQAGELAARAGAFSGDVAIGRDAAFTLTAETDQAYGGTITGQGLFQKAGAAALILTGNSLEFAGTTLVREGLLVINGALGGGIDLAEGAALGGSGTLASLTVRAGGVASPGNSIGTLTVAGDLTFEAGSVYEVEVDPASDASDRIVVGGTATLNGGVVRHVGLTGEHRPSSTYTILTAEGGVTGTFDAVETDFAFLDASLAYQANAVLMSLERNQVAFPDVGATFNQRATGAAVESTGPGAPLYDAVIGLNADNARLAFDELSGELHGSIRSAMTEDASRVRADLIQRMLQAEALEDGMAFWTRAQSGRTRLGPDGEAASLTHGSTGLMMGADARFGGLRLGLAGGAAEHDHRSASRGGEADGRSWSLAAYGSGRWGGLGLRAGASGTWREVATTRAVVFPGLAETLRADYDARTIQAFAEAGWAIPVGTTTLEPFVSAARARTETDAFAETGGVAALSAERQVQAVTLATLGLGASRAFDQGDGRIAVLNGRLGWRHASGDLEGSGRHAFATGDAFTVRGLPVAEDAVVIDLGLQVELRDRMAVSVDWSAQAGSDHDAHAFSARLNWRF